MKEIEREDSFSLNLNKWLLVLTVKVLRHAGKENGHLVSAFEILVANSFSKFFLMASFV
jgi:hypothetical protein